VEACEEVVGSNPACVQDDFLELGGIFFWRYAQWRDSRR
jgi:hypothetical protein